MFVVLIGVKNFSDVDAYVKRSRSRDGRLGSTSQRRQSNADTMRSPSPSTSSNQRIQSGVQAQSQNISGSTSRIGPSPGKYWVLFYFKMYPFSNNYLIIFIRCQFPSLSGSAGSNPRVTSGVQAPSPSPFRSTVNEEEEEDENEAHSRHQNEIRGRSPEEHEGAEDCEPSETIYSKPNTGRRRGGGSREQRSLFDYNSSGPSFAAVRGDNSSGPSFARGNNSI